MKPLYTVAFLAVALLLAPPIRAQSQGVSYKPFATDSPPPWRRAEQPGPLQHAWYAMDFTSTSMPAQNLSDCSITVQGPPDNGFVHRIGMQHHSDRICAIDWYVGQLLTVAGSKQILKCGDSSPPPDPPNPTVIVTYSYNATCSFAPTVASTPP
jgi:hypothetical protein